MSGLLLLRRGRILDASQGIDREGDVLVADGRIARVSTGGSIDVPQGTRQIDCGGKIIAPGLIDPHVHLREPGGEAKETIKTGTASAVAGGFTTVCCMPNTTPAIDTTTTVRFVQQAAREAGSARVFVVAAATVERKGELLAPMAAMAAAGAVGFSDDGEGIDSPAMMRRVLEVCASLGKPFMQHCQDHKLAAGGVMNEGPTATRLGLLPWPREAEEIMLERDVRLNRAPRARYHAQHLSSGGSAAIIRSARAAGLPVSGEVSPHHLLLTDDACDGYSTLAKMNPPLRTRADIDELKRAVADGTIDVLATDHAPHTAAEKSRDFASAPFGIIGLDCALALYAKALVDDGVIGWPRLVELLTRTPADLCGLSQHGYGSLREGSAGDVTVIDPNLEWTIDVDAFASKSRNCPFDGWRVKGRATTTIVGGRVMWELAGN